MGFVRDERGAKRALPIRVASLLLVAAWMGSTALGLNPSLQISQYAHGTWRLQDELFGGIPMQIAQTADGYIWIGTNIGLVRFDGVRFVPWNPPLGERLLDSRVFSLLGARDGSLWIGTGYSVSRWKNGELTNFPKISGRIESLVEDAEGAVWLVRTQATDDMGPICRMQGEQWQCYGAADAFPVQNATKLAESDGGELWIQGYSALCRWKPGSSTTYLKSSPIHPEGFAALRAITPGKDGSVWVAVDQASTPLRLDHISTEGRSSLDLPGIPAVNADVTALFEDGDGALWIGTAHQGMFRVRGENIEHIGSADGLSSDAVGGFFQDVEGTIWVTTASGIDNFRDKRVTTYSMREGLSAAGPSSIFAAHDGTVWVGNFEALDFMRDGKLSAIRAGHGLPGRFVTTLYVDHPGRLWFGADTGLWVYDQGEMRSISHADGSSLGNIFAITEDTNHDIWVRAGTHLDRIHDMKVEEEPSSPQISVAWAMAANPRGGVFLGLANGDLVEYRDGVQKTIPSHETGNEAQIRDLLVDPDGSVWGTNMREVVRWKDGQRKNLTPRNGLPCDGIYALVRDSSEDIWFYARCGLVRIAKPDLDHWWDHPDSVVKVNLLGEFDGVQPGLTSLKPQIARTPDGRLWFVNGRILQMFDPARSGGNVLPPPVHIEEIVADRRSYLPGADLRLPALTRDLEIDYTALSFVAPKRVLFRYRLEGRDAGWQDPGTRRQAFYSDLSPGKYTFHVIACNNDGVWNETGAALNFVVLPALYQTVWFRVTVLVLAALVFWTLYLLRMKQVTEQIQGRLNERMAERERIARELHDTLLQGFQGLVLRFQAVMKQLPQQGPARAMMEKALDRADDVLLEGRQRVRDLRSEAATLNELGETLKSYGSELADDGSVVFTLAVIGTPKVLDSIVADESYRIGREALSNAFRHAHAAKIEVEITYDRATLRVRVRDDGVGMDQTTLNGGRPGHWGLSGMRERAERIGGELSIWSNHGVGTEIDLTVPAKVAYSSDTNGTGRERIRRPVKRRK
jgi:signal transduction histidine kinase/ligand-binding sensor domain-containing protein